MDVGAIIGACTAAVDAILRIVDAFKEKISSEDLVRLKLAMLAAIEERESLIKAQEAKELKVLRGDEKTNP